MISPTFGAMALPPRLIGYPEAASIPLTKLWETLPQERRSSVLRALSKVVTQRLAPHVKEEVQNELS